MAVTNRHLVDQLHGWRSNVRELERMATDSPLRIKYLPRNQARVANVESQLRQRGVPIPGGR
jgi:hypothetical protein